MRIAISNIAWDVSEDEGIAGLLTRYQVDAIDIAPGKYFPDLAHTTEAQMLKVKNWWQDRGIEITGMQALLFGTTGLNVFGTMQSQEAMLDHLASVCRIGSVIGATKLVFGSPKNRDRTGLSDLETIAKAVPFFRRLGNIAQSHGVMICLEPNPVAYGSNFMTNSSETAQVVRAIAHPAIRMQFDTGALVMNQEDPIIVLKDCSSLIGHIHASEPNLLPIGGLGVGRTNHADMSAAIKQYLPNQLVSIEMVATKDEAHIKSIECALKVAHQYRNSGGKPNS